MANVPKWKQEITRVQENAALLEEALCAILLDKAERVGQFTYDGFTVSAYLINPERAHGGLVLYKQMPRDGSSPSVQVAYLERQFHDLQGKIGASDYINQMYTLTGKAMTAMQRYLDAQKTNQAARV